MAGHGRTPLSGGRGAAGAISFLLLLRQCDRRHERGGGITGNVLATVVEQFAVPVFLEDRAEHPAMPVKVGELRVTRLWIQLRERSRKPRVGPVSAGRSLIRVGHVRDA